ncbi:MAG: sugar kinase [Deltaproteobacteria bacterium]|nr:sugar kinase [Deltaproteobacteria bacterium]
MIISKAPVRISLGGGGTDLASYYSKFGGFLIAGAIDKYLFLAVNHRFENNVRLSYSQTEIVENAADVKHPLFRECLRKFDITRNLEIVSLADVPGNSGLGTSSCFTVALLNGLHAYKRNYRTLKELAEEACHLEIDILKEPIGKQDQYICSLGGLLCLTIDRDGTVHAENLNVTDETLDRLEHNLLLFYTGVKRAASDILHEQNEKSAADDSAVLNTLHEIKEIGLQTRRYLESGRVDEIGHLFDVHWEVKKRLSGQITNPFLDQCYSEARKAGALGGKVMGAGGGGFFIYYCPDDASKRRVREVMQNKGLWYTPFRFDFEGAKIVSNMRTRY